MIRIILATIAIIGSLVCMLSGQHPSIGIVLGLIGMILTGWYCVSKFEDNPSTVQY